METLLTIWPSIKAIADDLNLPYPTVQCWGNAGRSIPAKRYGALIAAAAARGHLLTFEQLEAANGRPLPAPADTSKSERPAA